jgi:hypothetical protein
MYFHKSISISVKTQPKVIAIYTKYSVLAKIPPICFR